MLVKTRSSAKDMNHQVTRCTNEAAGCQAWRTLCTSRSAVLLSLFVVAGCGVIQPGTLGYVPSSAGRYNPISGEENSR